MVTEVNGHRSSQQGMATLLTAVVLLIAVLGVTFIMSDVIIREKQLVANEYRAKQAFQVAQGGIDYAVAYVRLNDDQDNDGNLDALASAALGVGWYEASLAEISLPDDEHLLRITAHGHSDDDSVQRTLIQTFAYLPILPNPPEAPLVARGTVSTTGNLSVTNNFENLTVWTGDDASAWGSANTYINIDGIDDQLSTTKNTQGPDVVDGDENLAGVTEDQLIQNFFGTNWAGLASMGSSLAELPADKSLAQGVYHTDGDYTLSGGVWGGSPNPDRSIYDTTYRPIILIVDGTLTLNGNVEFNGLIVARNIVKATGTPLINGGVIATQNMDFGAGSLDVVFYPVEGNGNNALQELGAVNGSWQDWE